MDHRNPADPPPVMGQQQSVMIPVPSVYIRTGETVDARPNEASIRPRKSFFRGVAVGLAIMIPVWAWLLMRLMH